jgi:hypothetical protein
MSEKSLDRGYIAMIYSCISKESDVRDADSEKLSEEE